MEETLERDGWSAERWGSWQEERLAALLHRAATRVPYYRERWRARRRAGDRAPWDRLENWPLLDKSALRADPAAFVADDRDRRLMFHEHTSGTTGTPLSLWFSRATLRRAYAILEARWRRWNGVSRHHRWASLGGQLVTPAAQREPPFWVWNPALRQLYMSSYHLAPELAEHYFAALRRHRVGYLWGYTSSLYALARAALDGGRRDLAMAVVLTNAEPVAPHQRAAIAEAFQCPVRETYSLAEAVAGAAECGHGRLHLWPEFGVAEVLAGGAPVGAGETGELVATGLLNADMPLVRYQTGDRAALAAAAPPCPCGRPLPILAAVEGRQDDVLITPDGRQIGRLDPVFKADLPLREAQIVQEARDRLRVRYVPAAGYTAATGRTLIARLRERMGDVEVTLEEVPEVPRTAAGKFRAVVSALPAEERLAGPLADRGRSGRRAEP